MLFVVAKLLWSCMLFCGGWLMLEKLDQAYPKKSACGKGIPEKMIITCTAQAVQPPLISQCAWLLSSYNKLANSQRISMKNTFCGRSGNKSKVNYAFRALYFAIPVAWNNQILPTPKKTKTLKWPNFLHIPKKIYDLSFQYVRIICIYVDS